MHNPNGLDGLHSLARKLLSGHVVRVLTRQEAGTQSYKGNKLVFDGSRAHTLDLAVWPVRESEEDLYLCSVAVSRVAPLSKVPPGGGVFSYAEAPLLIYHRIGYGRGRGGVAAEMRRLLDDLGAAFEESRKAH